MKKGLCYRCLKGNRFMEKEVCIVCGANYCYDCVLRAMGSMPEGRKCVTCVGFRMREARREKLGKCPRLLKRLLTDSKVKNIMNVEMLCEVNQLPPELVVVNGETLSQDELFRLKHCEFPPKKLGPGYYWGRRMKRVKYGARLEQSWFVQSCLCQKSNTTLRRNLFINFF